MTQDIEHKRVTVTGRETGVRGLPTFADFTGTAIGEAFMPILDAEGNVRGLGASLGIQIKTDSGHVLFAKEDQLRELPQ